RVGLLPAAILAAASVIAGLVPGWVGTLPYAFGNTFTPVGGEEAAPLALWHGFNIVLGLSALIILVGLLLFVSRARVTNAQESVPTWIDSARLYRMVIVKLADF